MTALDLVSSDQLLLLKEHRARQKRSDLSFEEIERPETFIRKTKVRAPQAAGQSQLPFDLWPSQVSVLEQLETHNLIVFLKARQLGITWIICAYAYWLCIHFPGKFVLVFSQGQLEANEIVDRIRFLHESHEDKANLPQIIADNTQRVEWSNGSKVQSLPATKRAGRSFSASMVIFDEFAFMTFGSDLFDAAKPTIDDGGKMIIISSADGQGTKYHQFWQRSVAGINGFTPIFLAWYARPTRGPEWRNERIRESFGDESGILREYPENDLEAFSAASGQIYQGVWMNAPDGSGNVTEDAEYIDQGGTVYWATDDGYSGKLDPSTGYYTAESHPRVILFVQQRPNGDLCIFDEFYATQKLDDEHIQEALQRPYKRPSYAVHGPGYAQWRGRIMHAGIQPIQGSANVEESIKELRRWLAPDINGKRRIFVHPRCKHFLFEMTSYRRDVHGNILKAYDHGPDALRYLTWILRHTN